MDTGDFRFEARKSRLTAELPARHAGDFRLGEIVTLRGSRFRIMDITPTHMSLRALPEAESQRLG